MLLHQYLPPEEARIHSLRNNKMWFSNPFGFNDVFELSTSLLGSASFIPHDMNAIIRSYVASADNLLPRLVNDEMIEILKRGVAIDKYESDYMVEDDIGPLFYSQLNRQGMVCLSKNENCELMWAYYAHGHRGFKITYEVNEMIALIQSKVMAVDVNYSNHRPSISCLDLLFTNTLTKILATKSINWAHENEVRLIKSLDREFTNDCKGIALNMPEGIRVVEVTAGAKISPVTYSDLNAAVSELEEKQGSHVQFSEIKPDANSYSLDIVKNRKLANLFNSKGNS